MSFAFVSCQQYEHGYFTAYRRMAEEDLDLVVHLGDYIYEYDPQPDAVLRAQTHCRAVFLVGNEHQPVGGEHPLRAADRRRADLRAVQPLQPEQVASIVDDRDRHRPPVLERFRFGGNVNYRGSTGFGLGYREAIKADGWGGREQDDIAAGIRHLIARGLAAAGKVGVTLWTHSVGGLSENDFICAAKIDAHLRT